MASHSTPVPPSYHRGVAARDAGALKRPPGHLATVWRYWWLAGWNDRDMEIGSKQRLMQDQGNTTRREP